MGVPSLNDLAVDGTLNTNKQTKKDSFPEYFKHHKSISDKEEIANLFNDYFINIGPNLAQNIHNAGAMTHKDSLANSNFSGNNFEFHSITENDVIDIINGFASKSSYAWL